MGEGDSQGQWLRRGISYSGSEYQRRNAAPIDGLELTHDEFPRHPVALHW
jgi:hypothetical protein